jgi:signal transduction histidine kinase
VSARRLDGRVEIDLYNSGPPLAGNRRGLGLRNTRERLHQLYGARAELSLEDAPGGVRARLAVPFEAAPAASEAAS